jgi:hypothetical protein
VDGNPAAVDRWFLLFSGFNHPKLVVQDFAGSSPGKTMGQTWVPAVPQEFSD